MKNERSKIKSKIFFLLIFEILFFIFYLPKANAEAISLKISPTLLQIRTEQIPYESTSPITIENLAEKGVNLRPQIKLFKAGEQGLGEVEYLDDQNPNQNFLDNIEILDERGRISELTLGPKQKKTVQLKISIPPNQSTSDYYFSVIFVSIPFVQPQQDETAEPNSFSTTSAGVAMNTLLSIGPRTEEKLSITDLTTNPFVQSGPVPFTLWVRNNGSQFINPTGKILIKNMFGQTIGKIDIPAQNILGNSSRFLASQDQLITYNLSPITPPQAVWDEKFLLGPYTAELTLDLSDGQTLTQKTKFFAFPIKLFFILALSTLGVLLIYKRVKHKMSQ